MTTTCTLVLGLTTTLFGSMLMPLSVWSSILKWA
jgi:hypothetical protein